MMKTADTRPGYHHPSTGAARPFFWGLLPKSTMRAILVVVVDVGTEQPLQMRLADGNHMIQQLAAAISHPALGYAILPRTADRGSDTRDVHRANSGGNLAAILGVVIEDEKPNVRVVRKRFPQLLHDPDASAMAGNVEVENTSPIMANDEEDIDHVEGKGRYREEVHGRDGFAMIA